jgi:putative redox protein
MIKTARGVHQGGMRFAIKTGSGHLVVVDDAGGDSGPRPAELLMVGQAGCTAMDVVSILAKKRQAFDTYEISVEGTQRDDPHPHVFERIEIVHELTGDDLDPVALSRAIELSATRYCTAAAMFSAGPAELHHRYVIHRRDGRPDEAGEVVVTGPRQDVEALEEQRIAAIGALVGLAR